MIKNKILHIIKTASFEGDGRLKKWINHLKNDGFDSTVYLIEDSNEDFTENFKGNRIIKRRLILRKIFKQRKGYLFKVPEYFFKVLKDIHKEEFNVIIFHDVQQYLNIFFFLLLNRNRDFKIIWDLHELPHSVILNNFLGKKFIRYIINNADLIIHTNIERRDYLRNKINKINERKYFILNNFPDRYYINKDKEISNSPDLKNNNPYFLWLGSGVVGRNFGAFLDAFLSFKENFNLVVLGKISPVFNTIIRELENENVIFHKFVPQESIINFIDNSFLSVVLYNHDSANNLFCEPNRLYQLIFRKIPVIVGSNPTMSKIVDEFNAGYVLNDDGRDSESIKLGIDYVIKNYDHFIRNLQKINYNTAYSWDDQFCRIIDYIKSH